MILRMLHHLRRFTSICGSSVRVVFAGVLVLLIASGLLLSRSHGVVRNTSFKQWAPTEAVWDTAQSEVEVASSQLRFEPEWVDRLLSFIASFDAVAPRVISWTDESELAAWSPVDRYGRIFSLPPPV